MNDTTRLSAKGQVVIPKGVRDALGLYAGQELDVVRMGNGVLLKPVGMKSGRSTDEIITELRKLYQHQGPPVTIEEMDAGVEAMFAAMSKDDI